jgi:hypothetical protein
LRRVYAADPDVFPEPLALWSSRNGDMAFVAMEKIFSSSNAQVHDMASDIVRIANALVKSNVVHRDVNPENLLRSDDGHLKLIDFQFAVDRVAPETDSYMRRNPKYHFVHFGGNKSLGIGVWSDAPALMGFLGKMNRKNVVEESVPRLKAMAHQMEVRLPVTRMDIFRLWCYWVSLKIQRWTGCKKAAKDRILWRLSKMEQLFGGHP